MTRLIKKHHENKETPLNSCVTDVWETFILFSSSFVAEWRWFDLTETQWHHRVFYASKKILIAYKRRLQWMAPFPQGVDITLRINGEITR
jgi:hypothetical protein